MSNIKDLFKNPYKILSSTNIHDLTSSHDVESLEYIDATISQKNRFFPEIDFSKPDNFVKYGQAERYYADSLKRIYLMYPYDGSHAEKIEWHNSSSYLDNYIFKNEYPRRNGYLEFNADVTDRCGTCWGHALPISEFFFSHSSPAMQYITVFGGPHAASVADPTAQTSAPTFKSTSAQSAYSSPVANIYDPSKGQASNFAMDGDVGNAVEMWVNLTAASSSAGTTFFNTTLFDLWNGNTTDISD